MGLEADIVKHSSKLETVSRSTILVGEISALQSELGALSKRLLQMDTMRSDERQIFAKAKADLEQGVAGAQMALNTLRNYYGASFVQQPAAPENCLGLAK